MQFIKNISATNTKAINTAAEIKLLLIYISSSKENYIANKKVMSATKVISKIYKLISYKKTIFNLIHSI